MIALLEARKAGLFARQHWLRNLLAMAFAIASGARPEQGLYTALWRAQRCLPSAARACR